MTAISVRSDVLGLVAAFVAAAVVIVLVFYRSANAFAYSLQSSTLEIRVLGFTAKRVPLSEIDNLEIVSFAALIPFSHSFRPNLLLAQKWSGYRPKVIALRRRSGLLRTIIIGPCDPESFANLLRDTIAGGAQQPRASTGWADR